MKILVTGGAGFIGSHIVDAYIAAGHGVIVMDNLSSGLRDWVNPKARFFDLDICDPAAATLILDEKFDLINHHAAQIDVRKSVTDPLFDAGVNILGFLNVMEAAKKSGVKKVIFASSGGAIYGDQLLFPASEDHPTEPTSPYGVAKLTCEKYLHSYFTTHHISYVALRYANVYGPRQNPHGEAGVVAIFVSKLLKNEGCIINGQGTQTRDYVFVKDIVKANTLALTDKMNGVYNVGCGIESSVNELYHLIAELTGCQKTPGHAPAQKGEVARSAISSDKLKKVTGFAPEMPLIDGIGQTVEWFAWERAIAND